MMRKEILYESIEHQKNIWKSQATEVSEAQHSLIGMKQVITRKQSSLTSVTLLQTLKCLLVMKHCDVNSFPWEETKFPEAVILVNFVALVKMTLLVKHQTALIS